MASQGHTIFLEEWLLTNSSVGKKISSSHSSSSAQAIIQAWSDLREAVHSKSFHAHYFQSLRTLCDSEVLLHISDPQAKLLLSILSLPTTSLPHEAYPLILRLLYVWLRKSSKQDALVIDSAVQLLIQFFSEKFSSNKSPLFFSEGILLFGAISLTPSASEKSKMVCLEMLCRLLQEEYQLISSTEVQMHTILAGIGYALSSPVNAYTAKIMDLLFGIWEKEDASAGSVSDGLMILHMMEWVLSSFIRSRSTDKVVLLKRGIMGNAKPTKPSFALVMAAAGILRACNRSGSSDLVDLKMSAEEFIETVARLLVSRTRGVNFSVVDSGDSLLLQCISLALVRSGSISYRASLLLCISSALLTEIFPLRRFYSKILGLPLGNTSWLSKILEERLNEVKEHLSTTIFKEAGAITGVFCNQYILADEESKNTVENFIWDYCQDVYLQHQQVVLMLRGVNDGLLASLEKIAESSFLMVVVFALAVTKHKLGSINQEAHMELSVRILVSFSCMEYFRRMHLSEYMDAIRAVVGSVQENQSACISFVESMPSYDDLTSSSNREKMEYHWSTDDVRTARVLFYLCVIPTCIEHLPTSVFRKVVGPNVFLYMGHPNGKVARASHSVFVAFMSSGKDPNDDERVTLKEQLVFYYIQRSLEGYPGTTPFEGMASGVAAIVRNLPAGSPSLFYCIHSLVEKANSLCCMLKSEETDHSKKNTDVDWEPCKKMLELLIRLLSFIDIQVLPSLMKQLAQLIVQLPVDKHNVVLNDLYQQIADSDDVIRKPTLVSWVQSLSYLSSQDTNKRISKGKESKAHGAASIMGILNGISSRL